MKTAVSTDPRWHFARLLSAPHRLGFFAAALLLAASGLWWAAALVARHAGLPWPWAVPPLVGHGLLMTMGFMPLFIVGFLFTAGPKWLGMPEVKAASLLLPVGAMVAGWLLAVLGFHLHGLLAALGVALVTSGWASLALRFWGMVRHSGASDRLHAAVVAGAAALGAPALAAASAGLMVGDLTLVRAAIQVALWFCLAPIFVAVSHRMIPFFTASALPRLDSWRPYWLLWVMLAVLGVSGAGAVAELWWWPLPAALHWVLVAVQAPAALLLTWLSLRWGLVQSLRIRMLAMLHAGFVWFGLAMALSALSHALQATGGVGLGLAPVHALGMGYLGATLIAMITRVAAGHSGRPLAADNLAWGLYWTLQAAALLRVASALWPQADAPLVLAAATAWAAAASAWALRYGGWLGRPRADGRPG